jgi:hypothetical protein
MHCTLAAMHLSTCNLFYTQARHITVLVLHYCKFPMQQIVTNHQIVLLF